MNSSTIELRCGRVWANIDQQRTHSYVSTLPTIEFGKIDRDAQATINKRCHPHHEDQDHVQRRMKREKNKNDS